MNIIRDLMQHVSWEANKKTIRPAHSATRVSNACMQSVRALQERGAFKEALKEMEGELKSQSDTGALILHALSHLGNADPDAVLQTLEKASQSLEHYRDAILLNRAQAHRVRQEFDAALSVANELLSVAEQWYASHLLFIGLHELREDREAARKALARLRTQVGEFSHEDKEELKSYLLNDTDFVALREDRDAVFYGLLGDLDYAAEYAEEKEVHP